MEKSAGCTYSLPEDDYYYRYISQQVAILAAALEGLRPLHFILSELLAEETQQNKKKHPQFEPLFLPISSFLLSHYTPQLPKFLQTNSKRQTNHELFDISVRGYHLRMIHLEVLNRLMKADFEDCPDKLVILPHCLRDFRSDECQFIPGDVDYQCLQCTESCLVNKTVCLLADDPSYHVYVSQITDLELMFTKARKLYPGCGLFGVACVPELYEGMKLCQEMGVPAQGLLLNYNRCRRWLGKAKYTNFNLKQFGRMVTLGKHQKEEIDNK